MRGVSNNWFRPSDTLCGVLGFYSRAASVSVVDNGLLCLSIQLCKKGHYEISEQNS